MKALILVGGFGTRLRPLTLTIPKPLVPFANKPMIVHQIEALKNVGVDEVVLAINYKPEVMKKEMDVYAKKFNIKITYSRETEPMGTAGPLALAKDVLTADGNELFFVLNSDISCTYPFADLVKFHKKHGKEGTIMVTKVSEPSKYGVVVTDDNNNGLIKKFVEKPQIYVGNRINAGIYLFNKKILNRIELKPTSIERVIFPQMASDNQLHAMDLEGFWMDIGQPKDYLTGMCMHLAHLKLKNDKSLSEESKEIIGGTVLIDENTEIGKGSVIGPNVVIGKNCKIGEGVRLKRCTIMDNVVIGSNSFVESSIIGWDSSIGSWCRVENSSVFGEDVHLSSELHISGTKILSHKEIKESCTKDETIIM